MIHASDCWTITEAAQQLGVRRGTIHAAIARGYIPAVRTDNGKGQQLVPINDARAWAARRPGKGGRPRRTNPQGAGASEGGTPPSISPS